MSGQPPFRAGSSMTDISTIARSPNADETARFSTYVTVRDGIRIAVEVWLPGPARHGGERVTTLCWFTRYWRAMLRDGEEPRAYGQAVAEAGLAFVHVDVRGSGASFGSRAVEYSEDEVADMGEIIDWIAAQDWSDGRVATGGISYVGNTAELAASLGRPALCAAVPQFTDYDFFDQILFPGGLLNRVFVNSWGVLVRALDQNDTNLLRSQFASLGFASTLGVRPVDGYETLLPRAIAAHAANGYYLDACRTWTFRDDVAGLGPAGEPILRKPLYAYAKALEHAKTPMLHWAGWLDSGTAAGALARFSAIDGPNTILVGPWNHGATSMADVIDGPDAPLMPTAPEQRSIVLRFIRDAAAGRSLKQKRVIYYTMGARSWRSTEVWPPASVQDQTLYLHASGALAADPPTAKASSVDYRVNYAAGTGAATRWTTSMGGGRVAYGDRSAAAEKLVAFTGEPLDRALTITGAVHVEIEIASTHGDIAVIAYLEAVRPDGYVHYITEGALRALHRRQHPGRLAHDPLGVNRSFNRADAWPLQPDQPARLAFNLLPTSVRIGAGWRLRISLAGHDKDSFERVPGDGTPLWRVFTQAGAASRIVIPVDLAPEEGGELQSLLW
jgi:uncharacterized protein